MEHVRAEASGTDNDFLTFIFTHRAREFEQLHRLVEGDSLNGELLGQLCKARLVRVLGTAYLHYRTVASNLHRYRSSALRVCSQQSLTCFVLAAGVEGLVNGRLKALIEVLQHLVPVLLAFGDRVETLLYAGREVIVHDVGEVLNEEIIDHRSDVRWQQFALLVACKFFLCLCRNLLCAEGVDGVCALFAFLVTLHNVLALLDGGDCRGVGRWSADAQFLQFVNQRGLRVSLRTL